MRPPLPRLRTGKNSDHANIIKYLFLYMTTKEEFLTEHNKLSPKNFKATMSILTRFQKEKPTLIKDNDWTIARIRRPFILWLSSQGGAKE
jgi:hypothetical protein